MMTDLFAHHYFDNPKAIEEFEDEDFDMAAELARIDEEAEADAAEHGTDLPPGADDWEDV